MDYEKLMTEVMNIINLHMNMYRNLADEAKQKGDEGNEDAYNERYQAVRDIYIQINKKALIMKNGK